MAALLPFHILSFRNKILQVTAPRGVLVKKEDGEAFARREKQAFCGSDIDSVLIQGCPKDVLVLLWFHFIVLFGVGLFIVGLLIYTPMDPYN